jgi:hypothetical protein
MVAPEDDADFTFMVDLIVLSARLACMKVSFSMAFCVYMFYRHKPWCAKTDKVMRFA